MLRNSFAGIPYFNLHRIPPPAAADQHASDPGVTQGITHQIEQDAFDNVLVAMDPNLRRPDSEFQALLLRQQRKILGHPIQYMAQGKTFDPGSDVLTIQPGNVEDGVEQILQGVYRRLDMRNQPRLLPCDI